VPARRGAPLGGIRLIWRPLRTGDGSYTLVHPVHGEACHSRAGAWQEARERFARACRLSEFRGEILRLLDIGTGLGLNLAAALEALDGTPARLLAVSLEKDESVLRAALELPRETELPSEVERWHAPVRSAIQGGLETGREAPLGRGTLRLLLGDARETLPALPDTEKFDAVFLDPFSPKVEPDLWHLLFLREIARRMAPGSVLSTYSASLSVRAALAAAGLGVAPGARVGTKTEGTLAGPDLDVEGFDERTRRRIERRSRALGQAR
jgi:tRNA U34 5-methylaminomethyl-2-thiouridine-forming methyltransferase MnmC